MAIRVDKVQLEIEVREHKRDAEIVKLNKELGEAGRKYRSLQNEVDKLADKQKNGAKLTDTEAKKLSDLEKELEEARTEYQKLDQQKTQYVKENKLETMTIHELSQEYKQYQMILKNLDPRSEYYEKTQKYLQALKDRMSELNMRTNETKSSLMKFIEGANQVGFAINSALAIKDRIVNWADQYVQSFAKMDEAMTDVMKYTGQTKAEVEDMNETFKQMTTRTPREELNALAGAAGRLGIQGKKDIEGFVDAADKINVALGDDLGEGAIDQIGKLTMVFGEDKTKGLNGAMLATGSAINVLGANSSANTGFITEFTSSMAGMAVNAKISQTDIMGYASALSQAGIEGQTASGVFAQLITKMFTDPARFAKAARLDVKAFTDLLKTDANAAILQFLEGLKQNGGFDALAPALKSLKMQGTQAVPVISSLINKMDELKKAQKDARQAYDEGTSIIEEFNNANSSAAAKLEMAKKALNDVSTELGQQLLPIVEGSISTGTASLKIISSLINFTKDHVKELLILASTIALLTGLWQAHVVWQKTVAAWDATLAAGKKVLTASMLLLRTAGVALQATWALLTKGVQGYVVVMRAARLASLTNPWAALATVLTVVGVAIYGVTKAWLSHNAALKSAQLENRKAKAVLEDMNAARKRSSDSINEEKTRIERLTRIIHSNAYSIGERRKAIEKLQGIVPGYHATLKDEGELHERNAKAIQEHINKLNDLAMAEALKDKMKQIQGEMFEAEDTLHRKQTNVKAVQTEINRNPKKYKRTFVTLGGDKQETLSDAGLKKKEELDKQKAAEKAAQDAVDILKAREKAINDYLKKNKTVGQAYDSLFLGGNTSPTSPTSPTTTTTDPQGGSDKEREKQRKELEAQAKASWEREKLELRQQYEGKKQLQEEWHQKEYDAEIRYLAKIGQLRDEYNADESDKMEAQNRMLDAIVRESNYQEEQRKRKHQESLRNIDQQQAEEELLLARQQLDGEIKTQDEFSLKKLEVEIRYQKMRLQLLQSGSAEYLSAQKQLLSLELQQKQQQEKEKESFMKSYYDTGNASLQNVMSDLGDFDKQLAMNQAYYDADLISFEQYQQNKTDIEQTQTEARQQIQQAAIDLTNQAIDAAQQMFQQAQQRETSAVDAKYKKLIAAAKKQGKDTTKLEEQQEAEKQEIRKKYAQKEFQLKVLQIISSTAMAIANVWSQWAAYPPVAAALSALAAASGVIQLATAKSAADQAAGLYTGGYSDEYQEGYTQKGNPKEQAGVIPVHKNEFVANHKAVANPEVRPVLDVIDRHQKMGDIRMLDATRMLEEAYGSGRYRGGFTRGGGGDNPDSESSSGGQLSSQEVIEILRRIAANTSDAISVKDLRKEIRHQEQLEGNARR